MSKTVQLLLDREVFPIRWPETHGSLLEQRHYLIVDERGWGWNGGKPAFTESWTTPESRSGIPPVRFAFHDDAQRVAQGLLCNFKTVIIVEVFSDRQQTPAGSS